MTDTTETKYECPFCGSEDVAIGRLHNVTINNLSLKDHPAAMCRRCGTVGPMVQDESTALVAFCTPRHFAEQIRKPTCKICVFLGGSGCPVHSAGNCYGEEFCKEAR